ncbi:MAG: hypothetical protein KBF76_04055 [Verrucomicrobiales bacterium]|jgi:hypothetical protein|nr:hypothetical protein [Verrucomicrobiales bacterium]
MRPFFSKFLLIFSIAAAYGIITRLLFAVKDMQEWLNIVSMAFIYTMPISLGALVCFLGYRLDKPSPFWAFGAPPITMFLLLLGSMLFKLEAAICILVAAPIVLPFTLLGGWIMSLLLKRRQNRGNLQVSAFVLLPFVVSPLEQAWDVPHVTRIMQNSISIEAPADRIWEEIYEVPAIQKEEIPAQWIYFLGFPRPVAAMIDKKGIGGKRYATFEGDVSFYEVVSEWDPPRRLSFSIKADPEFIPHTAFDEHIIVGGRFYDVLDGTYEIESIDANTSVLHLESTHRLSTRFNAYAGWWSEWVMNQIQGSILEVIQKRCETPPVPGFQR